MHQFFCRIYVNMRIEELFSIIRGDSHQPEGVFFFLSNIFAPFLVQISQNPKLRLRISSFAWREPTSDSSSSLP